MTTLIPILFIVLVAVGGLVLFTGWENVRQAKKWRMQPIRTGSRARLDWSSSEAREMK